MNLLLNIPPEIVHSINAGDPPPAGLSEIEKAAYEQRRSLKLGYLIMQATRPQTIGYSLADSPAGLAAWMLDHDPHSYEQISHVVEGHAEGCLTRDEILDNITLTGLPTLALLPRVCTGRMHASSTRGRSLFLRHSQFSLVNCGVRRGAG